MSCDLVGCGPRAGCCVNALLDLLGEAARGQIHVALGYSSWTGYVKDAVRIQPSDKWRATSDKLTTNRLAPPVTDRVLAHRARVRSAARPHLTTLRRPARRPIRLPALVRQRCSCGHLRGVVLGSSAWHTRMSCTPSGGDGMRKLTRKRRPANIACRVGPWSYDAVRDPIPPFP
jgi:hypothetical protein